MELQNKINTVLAWASGACLLAFKLALVGLLASCASPPARSWEYNGLSVPPLLSAPPVEESAAPDVTPFKLPTFSGDAVDYHTIPAVSGGVAPRMDFDAVFATVLACYPMPSLFRLDVEAQAVAGTAEILNLDNTTQGRAYLQIVAKMPLYSSAEVDRVTQFESNLREKIATDIGDFFEAIARSTQAHRYLGLYSSLESRSQARVAMGIAETKEQAEYLAEVIKAAGEVTRWDTDVDSKRLQLVAYCREGARLGVSRYLQAVQKAAGAVPDSPLLKVVENEMDQP